MSGLLVQGAAAAGLLVALAWARRAVRRRPATAGLVEVVERRMLGRETGLAVVRWRGAELLVGFGPAGPRLLSEACPLCEDAGADHVAHGEVRQ